MFNGKQLEDDSLLSLAGVADEATLYVLGRLLGGAKKRKKKTYTKPKKIKHKHKKIKLRVLKFYKVRGRVCGLLRVTRSRAARSRVPRSRHPPSPPTTPPPQHTTHHHATQVDDSGKVQRLRKQCPQCGPGIFMATHFDRVYCGKCATTYLVEQAPAKGKGKK